MKATRILIILSALVILSTLDALGASGATGGVTGGVTSGAHVGEHIPFDKIGWQAANLGILLVIIFFAAKKSIVETFKNRQLQYLERAEKTKSALKEAEQALAGIKEKLNLLEAGEKKSLENAQREAEAIQAQLIRDAVLVAEKIKKDAELTINNEASKAKAAINQAILNQALVSAAKNLSSKGPLSSSAQEAGFIKQIEHLGQVKTEKVKA
jgi:F0F1-type ATP synthase membrane subunit b/b'